MNSDSTSRDLVLFDSARDPARLAVFLQGPVWVVPLHQNAATVLSENGIAFSPLPSWDEIHRNWDAAALAVYAEDPLLGDAWRNVLVQSAQPLAFIEALTGGARPRSVTLVTAESTFNAQAKWLAATLGLPLRRHFA